MHAHRKPPDTGYKVGERLFKAGMSQILRRHSSESGLGLAVISHNSKQAH